MARSDDIRLDLAEFRLLRELFNEHCGIVFGVEARLVVERRLRDRLAALGLSSFSEYYQLLRFDERGRAELEEAINLVTINETYFLREAYQLRAYKDEILPALRAAPAHARAPQRVERRLLHRRGGLLRRHAHPRVRALPRPRVRDLRQRHLAPLPGPRAARRLRRPPPSAPCRPTCGAATSSSGPTGRTWPTISAASASSGTSTCSTRPRSSVVGRVDVIFCRNVLIYFDDVSRRRVIEMFYERLLPGGYLLLGHSESLLNVSTAFELVHLREDLVYRKPVSSTRFWSSGDFFRRDGSIQAGARASLAPSVSSLRPIAGLEAVSLAQPGVSPQLPGQGAGSPPIPAQPATPRPPAEGAREGGSAPRPPAEGARADEEQLVKPLRPGPYPAAHPAAFGGMLPPKAPRGGSR